MGLVTHWNWPMPGTVTAVYRGGLGMQNHLPETSSEVDGTKNSTARLANFTNALTHVFHRVLVRVGLVV